MELRMITDELERKYERMMDTLWQLLVSGRSELVPIADQAEQDYQNLLFSDRVQGLINLPTAALVTPDQHLEIKMIEKETLEHSRDSELRKEMNEIWSELNFHFATFRPIVHDQPITELEILSSLSQQKSSSERQKYWEAFMKSGIEIESQLLSIVHKRNRVAVEKGYSNFYEMKLSLQDLTINDLKSIIYNLKSSLDSTYCNLKQAMDKEIMERFKIPSVDIKPWHYNHPFLQYYKNITLPYPVSMEDLENTMKSIGLDISSLLSNGCFTKKEGKSPSGFCFHTNRKGDIRISVNQNDTFHSLQTLLHELGHGAYEMSINPQLPFLLKQPSQIFISEAVALLFEKMPLTSLFSLTDRDHADVAANYYKNLLVRLYWSMTLILFEIDLYENPHQNLNEVWWNLVQDVQGINRPEEWDFAYWASKSHLSTLPGYYHNYLLGDMLASTLFYYLTTSFQQPFSIEAMQDLKEHLFYPGAGLQWNNPATADFFLPLTHQHISSEIKSNLRVPR
ncbi:hypothetical protein QUF84_00090 [Fictibacillus enclensis]|uniref:hypothetical protein n=1 Tax=Fictibacillus enclensis TaxID=1017270 RepID=UPI0025A1AD9A|nr:hypothetical protein [Fictibacillus enclensis]MDM5335695.1 hypothetical protein [Fictibacillus enclensis]